MRNRRAWGGALTVPLATALAASLLGQGPGTDPGALTLADHDSLGIFQQRANWGSAADRLNPAWATNAFLDKMQRLYPNLSWQSAQTGAPSRVAGRLVLGNW
ncbi:hypothetical protein Val02_53080 [Virgisporangium aliadipatigenens]|uniref:Uncharacterized protein n=1 Tax=Virgisporangium aliadipatigenens TaxID=741659 RepID=A0A8J3YPX6_9ACTN|nr:hypothetical protein [Virgisporangium aliadipatigenens]GIJ48422.1 hypothetical protein Val02_53080 [Virgisporangium aliadipatigenens]